MDLASSVLIMHVKNKNNQGIVNTIEYLRKYYDQYGQGKAPGRAQHLFVGARRAQAAPGPIH